MPVENMKQKKTAVDYRKENMEEEETRRNGNKCGMSAGRCLRDSSEASPLNVRKPDHGARDKRGCARDICHGCKPIIPRQRFPR